MENDDIEILDIFDDNKKAAPKKVEYVKKSESDNKNKEQSPKKKKKKLKVKGLQIAFCSVSALFLLTCLIYYGSRFIKYYRIYNPKVESGEAFVSNYIKGNTEVVYEGNGLYTASGSFVFKGDVDNNYLIYNNMLWRILRVNIDGSIEIILDDYMNMLPWNSEVTKFSKTELYDYLNQDFLDNLNKDLLVSNNPFCDSVINKITDECTDNNITSYVKLLDVKDFLNTVVDKKSYLVNSDELFWLSNYSEEKVWHTNGVNASLSDSDTFYEIRPVVKLKNTIIYTKGDGTKDNPYRVDEDNLGIGSMIMLGEDKWIVYDMQDNVKLMRYELLKDKQIFDKVSYDYSESSLKEYLNTTYLDSLSYKDKIIENEYYVGAYNDKLSDIKEKKVKVSVSIPNIKDIKFDSSIKEYFMATEHDEVIWVYDNPFIPGRITTQRSVRPCITISKEYANSLKLTDGVFKEAE